MTVPMTPLAWICFGAIALALGLAVLACVWPIKRQAAGDTTTTPATWNVTCSWSPDGKATMSEPLPGPLPTLAHSVEYLRGVEDGRRQVYQWAEEIAKLNPAPKSGAVSQSGGKSARKRPRA